MVWPNVADPNEQRLAILSGLVDAYISNDINAITAASKINSFIRDRVTSRISQLKRDYGKSTGVSLTRLVINNNTIHDQQLLQGIQSFNSSVIQLSKDDTDEQKALYLAKMLESGSLKLSIGRDGVLKGTMTSLYDQREFSASDSRTQHLFDVTASKLFLRKKSQDRVNISSDVVVHVYHTNFYEHLI